MISPDLAEKYINDHNNPITRKTELFGSKLFLAPLNEQHEQLKEKCLDKIESILRHERVDRRVARSVAEWIPEQKVAKVTKITGASADFGIQNKNGKFLNPEETLFLMEMNRLELTCTNIPVSIEQAYKNVNLEKYLAYKKLALQGFKLKLEDKDQNKEKKRNREDIKPETSRCGDGEPLAKIAKLENEDHKDMMKIFETLRQNGPRSFHCKDNTNKSPDYYVNAPTEKTEHFNLIVVNEEDFKSTVDNENVNVYALPCDDNVAFYKFYNANVPILE